MSNGLKGLIKEISSSRAAQGAARRSHVSKWDCFVAVLLTVASFPSYSWAMSAPGGADGQSQGGFALFMPMILVFLIFYFLMIRPQAKQQKQHQALLKQLKRGDEVITASGIFGKVTSVTEETIGLEISDNVRIRLEKKQVGQVVTSSETPKEKAKK